MKVITKEMKKGSSASDKRRHSKNNIYMCSGKTNAIKIPTDTPKENPEEEV